MQKYDAYGHGFGDVWKDVYVHSREGYSTSVTDYHEHGFYEINLILSGNVKILLGDRSEEGTENRIVLTRPKTPHYIACKADTLYSRLYLNFSDEFVADRIDEWQQLSAVFGEKGAVVTVTKEATEEIRLMIEQIRSEEKPFRQRLLIYFLLSRISELAGTDERRANPIPPYIVEVLAYLEKNYSEKILASELAKRLHVGRTTLMTEFKKHTGRTLGEYLTHCRLKNAIRLLREGRTLEYTAEACGFSDSSGLIRGFRRIYGTTPRQYLETVGK